MSKCIAPIQLKNGIVVPCGKCEICRSNRRNEWSTRLAIHVASHNTMPLMVTLTYDDVHLPYRYEDWSNGNRQVFVATEVDAEMSKYWSPLCPTLHRYHVSRFIKAYKRGYGLLNDEFQYFGCGEYGDRFGRPHYHLLLFGDDDLYRLYFEEQERAVSRIARYWVHGYVHVCIADWSGIHYCTKYVLKDSYNEVDCNAIQPFTIASNGLGMNFLNTHEGLNIRKKLEYLTKNFDRIFLGSPGIDYSDKQSVINAIEYWREYVPKFETVLPDGKCVTLPRAIRKKLVGTFEHYRDNPLWVYNALNSVLDSINYYEDNGEYDRLHDMSVNMEKSLSHIERIHRRLKERSYNKKFNRVM